MYLSRLKLLVCDVSGHELRIVLPSPIDALPSDNLFELLSSAPFHSIQAIVLYVLSYSGAD